VDELTERIAVIPTVSAGELVQASHRNALIDAWETAYQMAVVAVQFVATTGSPWVDDITIWDLVHFAERYEERIDTGIGRDVDMGIAWDEKNKRYFLLEEVYSAGQYWFRIWKRKKDGSAIDNSPWIASGTDRYMSIVYHAGKDRLYISSLRAGDKISKIDPETWTVELTKTTVARPSLILTSERFYAYQPMDSPYNIYEVDPDTLDLTFYGTGSALGWAQFSTDNVDLYYMTAITTITALYKCEGLDPTGTFSKIGDVSNGFTIRAGFDFKVRHPP